MTQDLANISFKHTPTPEEWKILCDACNLLDKWVAEGKPWEYKITYVIP